MIGIVINPRDGIGYEVESAYETVFIQDRVTGDSVGEGTYEYMQSTATTVTGYPRAHTENGVTEEGAGLGTVLYTGICMSAAMASKQRKYANDEFIGEGISSDRSRSPSARKWWNNAKTKYDLAYEVEKRIPHPFKNYMPVFSSSTQKLIDHEMSLRTGKPTHAESFRVDGVEYDVMTADAYPFSKAIEHHLVAFTVLNDKFDFIDPEAIQAMNVSNGIDADDLILVAAKSAGLSNAKIKSILDRSGIDEKMRKNPYDGRLKEQRRRLGWDNFRQ